MRPRRIADHARALRRGRRAPESAAPDSPDRAARASASARAIVGVTSASETSASISWTGRARRGQPSASHGGVEPFAERHRPSRRTGIRPPDDGRRTRSSRSPHSSSASRRWTPRALRPDPRPSSPRGDHQRRPVVALGEPRRDDPDHAADATHPTRRRAPAASRCSASTRAVASRVIRSSTARRSALCTSSSATSDRARVRIVRSSAPRRPPRASARRPPALSRGASRKPIARTVARSTSADLLERDEARAGRSIELAQSVRHQNPVLVDATVPRPPPSRGRRDRDTDGGPAATRVLARAAPSGAPSGGRTTTPAPDSPLKGNWESLRSGIQHRERRRPLGWSMMVITDDHVHAERPCKRQLRDVGRSAVRRDHDARSRGVQFPQRVGVQPVSLARTMGNVQQRSAPPSSRRHSTRCAAPLMPSTS